MRAFIAIEIPEDIRAKLAQVSEDIKKSGLVQGTFVNRENIHLTLKFLGNDVREEDVEKIKKAFSSFDFSPFNVIVKGIGFFPSEEHVKIIWAGVQSKELEILDKKISRILSEIGIKTSEDHNFHGHLTIARINGIKSKDLFKGKISQINLKTSEFPVNGIHLFKSELTSRGPVYKKLASFNFVNL